MAKKSKSTEPSLRDRLTSALLEALERDWVEHGTVVITAVRESAPAKYAELIVRLVPVESSLIAPGDFSQCNSEEDIAKRLLAQVGMLDSDIMAEDVEAATRANAAFIDTLLQIKARSNGGNA